MKVTMIVRDDQGKELEKYVVPDHSWVQTDKFGAQHVPAVEKPTEYALNGGKIQFIPENPPLVPEHVRKVIDGRDEKWGKNGFEWMGTNRERAGGTTLDRARELFAWCGSGLSKTDFPAPLSFNDCMSVMQDKKYCREMEGVGPNAFVVNSKDVFDTSKNPNISLSPRDILNNPNIPKRRL